MAASVYSAPVICAARGGSARVVSGPGRHPGQRMVVGTKVVTGFDDHLVHANLAVS